MPTIVFDIGAPAERIKKYGGGWTLPITDIPVIYEKIINLASDLDEQIKAQHAIAKWQRSIGIANNTAYMSIQYYNLYSQLLKGKKPTSIKPKFLVAFCSKWGRGTSHLRMIDPCINNFTREVSWLAVNSAQLKALLENNLIDAAILQRGLLDKILVKECLQLAKKHNIPYAWEIDDDLYADKDYVNYKDAMDMIAADAAYIQVSTPLLAKKYNQKHSRVYVAPSKLASRHWPHLPIPRLADGCIRAFYHGIPSHQDDLLMLIPVLEQIHKKYPFFRLALLRVGENVEKELEKFNFLEAIQLPINQWPFPHYTQALAALAPQMDFGLAPLVDNELNNGKSYLKALEYAALGLTCVASSVGPYKEASHIPHITLCQNNPCEWFNALESRIQLGFKNRQQGYDAWMYVQKNYMINDDFFKYRDNLAEKLLKK